MKKKKGIKNNGILWNSLILYTLKDDPAAQERVRDFLQANGEQCQIVGKLAEHCGKMIAAVTGQASQPTEPPPA